MADPAPTTRYDELPYLNKAFPQTHPNRLATLGRLFGLQPAPIAKCRVLELGCASGVRRDPRVGDRAIAAGDRRQAHRQR